MPKNVAKMICHLAPFTFWNRIEVAASSDSQHTRLLGFLVSVLARVPVYATFCCTKRLTKHLPWVWLFRFWATDFAFLPAVQAQEKCSIDWLKCRLTVIYATCGRVRQLQPKIY